MEEFVTKYFSFIVLGLVMTIGYVFWRVKGPKGESPTKSSGLEEALHEAELEAWRLKSARDQGISEKENEVLALTPEQAKERERLQKIADAENLNSKSKEDEVEEAESPRES